MAATATFNNRTFETLTWGGWPRCGDRKHRPPFHGARATDAPGRRRQASRHHRSHYERPLRPQHRLWLVQERVRDVRWPNGATPIAATTYAAEWLALARKLWTEEAEFDWDGEFFQGKGLWSQPKPIQSGGPAIMNAGSSPVGQRFSAENCDMNFVMLRQKDEASDVAQINGAEGPWPSRTAAPPNAGFTSTSVCRETRGRSTSRAQPLCRRIRR